MIILGIETSCDETSAAVISATGKNVEVSSNIVSSQIKLHTKWGGVVPHLASREHTKNIDWVLAAALKESGVKLKDIGLIAVTSGPGLIVSLVIGTVFAKALAWKNDIPLLGINHMEGHIYSNWIQSTRVNYQLSTINYPSNKIFPALCLAVSGGHTQLILMKSHGKYKMIGETLDDAAGEAFDKIARILGLGYPGGPLISKYAELGNPTAFDLPRPMLTHKNYNFSFSGLKTAVLYLVRDLTKNQGSTLISRLNLDLKRDIAASAQEAIVDVLVTKTIRAAKEYKVKSIMLSGGVSANKLLRERLIESATLLDPKPYTLVPSLRYTTDNAAMIAVAGYFNWIARSKKQKATNSWRRVKPDANWEIV